MDTQFQLVDIPYKGKGLIAKKKIPKDTVIINEYPSFMIPVDEYIFSDMFQLLYIITTSENKDLKQKFYSLLPNNINNFLHLKGEVLRTLDRLNKMKNTYARIIHSHFTNNFTENELLLLCAKYTCNAFDFGNHGPVILFIGTLLNHSCEPNVVFKEDNGHMIFITTKDIDVEEELCDNYVNINLPTKKRTAMLKSRYGFDCNCNKCSTMP
jgi:SET domain-containing protein